MNPLELALKDTPVLAYEMNEQREEYIKKIEAQGFRISLPAENELQLDIDDEEQWGVFKRNSAIFFRELREKYPNFEAIITVNVSRSGMPSRHVRITLPFTLTTYERIAWQAALGSDPVRELLSCWRAHLGDIHPTLLVETPVSSLFDVADKIRALKQQVDGTSGYTK